MFDALPAARRRRKRLLGVGGVSVFGTRPAEPCGSPPRKRSYSNVGQRRWTCSTAAVTSARTFPASGSRSSASPKGAPLLLSGPRSGPSSAIFPLARSLCAAAALLRGAQGYSHRKQNLPFKRAKSRTPPESSPEQSFNWASSGVANKNAPVEVDAATVKLICDSHGFQTEAFVTARGSADLDAASLQYRWCGGRSRPVRGTPSA